MRKKLLARFFLGVSVLWNYQHRKEKSKQGVLLISFSLGLLGLKHEGRKKYAEVKLYLQERENPWGRRAIFFATVTEVCALSPWTYVHPYFHITK